MTIKLRLKHSAAFKAKVTLETVRGERTVAELASNMKPDCLLETAVARAIS